MSNDWPTLDQQRRLYELAVQVKELAPWDWLEESDVFGVQDPDTGDLGFVSVMGMLGAHYAVAVYQGAEGLYGLWEIIEAGPALPPEAIFGVPQLQASFEDREILEPRDRAIIKQLGLKFRGRQAWPMFRSYRPGFFPWFVETGEARLLAHALEQTLDVAPRAKEKRMLLQPKTDDSYLVRVARREGPRLEWRDRVMRVPPPEPTPFFMPMDADLLDALKRAPRHQGRAEVDCSLLDTVFQDSQDERPFFSLLLLVVDRESGFILTTELLKPDPTLEALWESVPLNVARSFARAGFVPVEVAVRNSLLAQLMAPLGEEVGFRVTISRRLPSLDRAVKELTQYMGLRIKRR